MGWNLISIPLQESVEKENITVRYLDTNYTWQEGVTNLIIIDTIYRWDADIQNYDLQSMLDPGKGYWMYAYSACDLVMTTTASSNDEHLTDLLFAWNLIGLPTEGALGKDNLTVYCDETNYTWQEAITNLIILDTIYGWDVSAQNYFISDTFDPGQGYWMYAYGACVLNKGEQ